MPFITGNVIGRTSAEITEADFNDATGARVVHAVVRDAEDASHCTTFAVVARALTPLELERWVLYLNEVLR